MITNAADMLRALKRDQFRGIILYEGASLIDGAPIVAIVNRITNASSNTKTGAMVQSFIIRSDVNPILALETGDDISICGDCKHRPFNGGKCYVQVGRSVASVFRAYMKGRYARPGIDYDPAILPELFYGLAFRGGTYGDPTAVPFMLWRSATLRAKSRTMYTHQWKDPRFQAFRLIAMASVDTEEEMRLAHSMGWRTFRVRRDLNELERGLETVCPASKEAGARISCVDCHACDGMERSLERLRPKASITILLHGPRVGKSLELAA